ncbi:MAG: phage integrase SAM-like domain-containing protein [Prevotella sp.]|nr:phage integrase SAM-like domain-containing protein [Prevotella sp.]
MATVKVKYRPSVEADKEGTIYYQIIQKRVVRQIGTDYHIFREEWDERESSVIISSGIRKEYLLVIKKHIAKDLKRLNLIIDRMEDCAKEFIVDDIINNYHESIKELSFYQLMDRIISQLKCTNRGRTAENYISTLKSFMRFRNSEDVLLEDINSDLMVEYEAYLKGRCIALNTVSFYMRILRAVYNRAVENGLTEQRNPFKYVYTGIANF